ncbi:hypothetical protein ACHAQA_009319 [Verticillium albo-atrum]
MLSSSKNTHDTQSEAPKFTYTTAGTIYNPDSVQPMQAPTRRSRSQRWGMPTAPAAELSFLPKSIIACLPMISGRSSNTAPVSSSSVVPHYSPLQQNYDRAVNPVTPANSPESPAAAGMGGTLRMRPGNVPANQPSEAPKFGVDDIKPFETAEMHHDSSDEDMSEDPISRLTVKSLHSLASYPNPNQHKARKALRARPGARSVASNGGNNTGSRSGTPSFGPYSFGSSDTGVDRSDSPFTFRGTQARHAGVRTFSSEGHQRDMGSARQLTGHPSNIDGPVGQFNSHPLNIDGPVRQFNNHPSNIDGPVAEDVYLGNTGAESTLAIGPSAPMPLTAGPPGQRQYKAANINVPVHSLQDSTEQKFYLADDDPAAIEFRALLQNANRVAATEMLCPVNNGNMTHLAPGVSVSPLKALRDSSLPEPSHEPFPDLEIANPLANPRFRGTHIWDTKQPEEVQGYYPHGCHGFQNFTDEDPDWQQKYPLHPEWQSKAGTFQRPDAHIQQRNNMVHRQFYAGASAFEKSVGQIAREAEQRHHKKTVGVIRDGRPSRGQAQHPTMGIKEANEMSASEAAKPFLTMILTSMINSMEEAEKKKKQQSARRMFASSSEAINFSSP